MLTYCRGHRWPAQSLAEFMNQVLTLRRDLLWFCQQHQIDLPTLLIWQGMSFMLDDMNEAYERTTDLFGVKPVLCQGLHWLFVKQQPFQQRNHYRLLPSIYRRMIL